jgi:hypothetical protein
VETAREGCVSAYCVVAGADRICTCLPQDGDRLGVVREKDGAPPLRWEVELHSIPDPSVFAVERVALGAPPAPALLVAVRSAVGNGMGIEVWELRAIQADLLSGPLAVEDYGILGYATRTRGADECRILATRWDSAEDPVRGPGLYLFGRWHRLEAGAWAAATDRPEIARRYLFRFERERLAALAKQRPEPIPWFRKATAEPPPLSPPRCDGEFCR